MAEKKKKMEKKEEKKKKWPTVKAGSEQEEKRRRRRPEVTGWQVRGGGGSRMTGELMIKSGFFAQMKCGNFLLSDKK